MGGAAYVAAVVVGCGQVVGGADAMHLMFFLSGHLSLKA
jgi:hypothetical protein